MHDEEIVNAQNEKNYIIKINIETHGSNNYYVKKVVKV